MKKHLSLDFIIILVLGFSFLLSWDKTNVFNFFIFLILCFFYLFLDKLIGEAVSEKEEKILLRYKTFLFFFIISFLLTVSLVMHILWRAQEPSLPIHDSNQQVEAAVEFLVQGKNPYVENYFNTQLASAAYVFVVDEQIIFNPALYHFAYLPAQFLLPAPFYLLSHYFFGFYDERIFQLLLFILSLLAVFSLPQERKDSFIFGALYALNPLFLNFFVAGRTDICVLSFIVFTFYFLKKDKILLSSLMLAVAGALKHPAFFLVPFYYLYLYEKNFGATAVFKDFWRKVKILWRQTWLLPVVFLLMLGPFIVWNPVAFYEDTVAYLSGSLITSYPINGYGLAMWLHALGLIKDIADHVPFWLVQLPASLMVFYFLARAQLKNNSLARTMFNYASLLFVYWFLARIFNDNYVGFLSQLFLLAYYIN